MAKKGDKTVVAIAIAEFDILKGNTLSYKYPQNITFSMTDELLASLCLPDGAHIHQEDWTYVIIPAGDEKDKKKGAVKESGPPPVYYGMGFFRNKADATVKRGAIQKSLLVVSRQPFYNLFEPMLRATVNKFIDQGETSNKILKTLYEALNDNLGRNLQVKLWNEEYPLNVPLLKEDQFGGASVIELIRKFREDTMFVWYALLMQQRLLFCGQPARAVGNCALAAPSLVAPLTGFTEYIYPYCCLNDMSAIERPTYICGTTNLLFETRAEWYDVRGSFTTGAVVSQNQVKIAGPDRQFIKNVLAGIEDNRGELWAREQFRQYTLDFLKAVEEDKLKGQQKKVLASFKDTELYKRYLANKDAMPQEDDNPMELLEGLKQGEAAANDEDKLSIIQLQKSLFELEKRLVNLSQIEQVCDGDGVSVVAKYLTVSSSQVRKYSVAVLAQLAISVKGQIAILSGAVLSRVIDMLKDPMPNVCNAACYCLHRISTLFIGSYALVEAGVPEMLGQIVGSEDANLVMKVRAVAALLQIYRYCPTAPRLATEPFYLQLQSPDRKYQTIILQLLDLWGVPLPGLPRSEKIAQHLDALSAEDPETRTQATSYLLSDLVSDSALVMELVDGGGVERIVENEALLPPEEKLPRISYAALTIVADHNVGRRRLLRMKVVEKAINSLNAQDPLYLFYVARFLEVMCQHQASTEYLYSKGGAEALVRFILQYHDKFLLNTLCLPALGALKYMVLFSPGIRVQITAQLSPLRAIAVAPEARQANVAAHDDEMQDLLNTTLRLVDEGSGSGPQDQAAMLEAVARKHGGKAV